MTPEGKVKKRITDFLDGIPDLEYELRQAGGWNYKKGKADIWFVYRGIHFEVEVKAPGGHPSALQLTNETKYKNAGALYWRGDSSVDFQYWFCDIVNRLNTPEEGDIIK